MDKNLRWTTFLFSFYACKETEEKRGIPTSLGRSTNHDLASRYTAKNLTLPYSVPPPYPLSIQFMRMDASKKNRSRECSAPLFAARSARGISNARG